MPALCYAGLEVLWALLEPADEAWDAEQGMPVQLRWMPADAERTDTATGAKGEGTR